MWVYRSVLYIKPGLMAEAIANLKDNPLPEGSLVRLLRPINGAEAANQLIQEIEFEDIDAVAANYGRPGPLDERVMRLVELNQNRAHRELYRVLHDVPCEGAPGLWVDRRTRYCPRARRDEALELWRTLPRLPMPGYSLRVLLPRTSSEREEPLVVEMTAASLEEGEAFDTAGYWPEFPEWVKKVLACEEGFPKRDLLRVVE
jgi:hypothetical protein